MPNRLTKAKAWVLGAVVCLAFASCGTTPEPFDHQTNEISGKQGPGVFTGEDGVWTIWGRETPPETQTPSEEEKTEEPAEKEAKGTSQPKDQESARD
jgi:hypothetical protein